MVNHDLGGPGRFLQIFAAVVPLGHFVVIIPKAQIESKCPAEYG